jgi:membrane protein YdbS with pleckstrin-like domain
MTDMEKEIDIDRHKIVTYWRVNSIFRLLALVLVLSVAPLMVFSVVFVEDHWGNAWRIIFLIMSILGTFLVIALLIAALVIYILPWYYERHANALRYSLVSKALRVESGVLFKSRKTIPFDKITGLELVQGPLLRYLDMWIIKVQTASTGARMPEATLLGVLHPEQVREDILAAKEEYDKSL